MIERSYSLDKSEAITPGKLKVKHNEKGEQAFPCFRCGICCTGYQIYMSQSEAEALAKNLGMTMETFAGNYIDPRWPGSETVVVRHVAGKCPFLEQPEGSILGICRIHRFKPYCCREWQASADRKECRQGLDRYWGLKVGEDGELIGSPEDILCFQTFVESLGEEGDE
jgi:Fe-S-cluster containining protein